MTLKEAGELYIEQAEKLTKTRKTLIALDEAIRSEQERRPFGMTGTVTIRHEIVEDVIGLLQDHLNHLEHIMQKEL